MRTLALVALLGLAGTLLPTPMATAGSWPSEFYSSIPKPVTACPAGDMVYKIRLYDFMNRPLRYNPIVLAFDHCPSFRLAPFPGSEGCWVDADYPAVGDTTDAAARVDFAIHGGGPCPARGVWILANGAIITRALASPDQDGDLVVSAADQSLASTKVGSTDPTADFDTDGTVTAADLDILSAHLGHHASETTPVRPTSWGTVKLLYR